VHEPLAGGAAAWRAAVRVSALLVGRGRDRARGSDERAEGSRRTDAKARRLGSAYRHVADIIRSCFPVSYVASEVDSAGLRPRMSEVSASQFLIVGPDNSTCSSTTGTYAPAV
jgi:hypothetical protein